MAEIEKLVEIYKQLEDAGLMVVAGKKDTAELMVSHDVVPVVRCKDCKYWKPGDSFGGDSLDDMQRIGGCPIMRFARREKDFCCEGERRTDGR